MKPIFPIGHVKESKLEEIAEETPEIKEVYQYLKYQPGMEKLFERNQRVNELFRQYGFNYVFGQSGIKDKIKEGIWTVAKMPYDSLRPSLVSGTLLEVRLTDLCKLRENFRRYAIAGNYRLYSDLRSALIQIEKELGVGYKIK